MRDVERLREKRELSLDDRQIAGLALAALLLLGGVFALGLLLGKHLAAQQQPIPAAPEMAALEHKPPPAKAAEPAPPKEDPPPAAEIPAPKPAPAAAVPAPKPAAIVSAPKAAAIVPPPPKPAAVAPAVVCESGPAAVNNSGDAPAPDPRTILGVWRYEKET